MKAFGEGVEAFSKGSEAFSKSMKAFFEGIQAFSRAIEAFFKAMNAFFGAIEVFFSVMHAFSGASPAFPEGNHRNRIAIRGNFLRVDDFADGTRSFRNPSRASAAESGHNRRPGRSERVGPNVRLGDAEQRIARQAARADGELQPNRLSRECGRCASERDRCAGA